MTTDRRKFLGSSDIAAVMGLSPWLTPLELYQRKISPTPETIDEERARFFARRKRQEPIVAEMLRDEYGITVTRLSFDDPNRYIDPQQQFLAAEIDFEFKMDEPVRERFPDRPDFAAIPDGTVVNGEIKTVHPLAAHQWGDAGTEEIPVHYAAQGMFGLGLTRRPAVLVAALFGLDNLACYPIMADTETYAGMHEKAARFWVENVCARVPPAPVNMDDMMRLFAKTRGRPVEADAEAIDLMAKLRDIRGTVANYEREQEEAELALAEWIRRQWGAFPTDEPAADNAIVTIGGAPALTWKAQSRSSIDAKRLRAERPEIAEQFTRTSTFRTFRFPVKQKG